MAKISSSNTKSQILQAYEEQVRLLQEQKKENTALHQELEKKLKLVEKTTVTVKEGAAVNI